MCRFAKPELRKRQVGSTPTLSALDFYIFFGIMQYTIISTCPESAGHR